MTRKELEQLHDLKKELKMWKAKLVEMEAQMNASASPAEATGVHSGKISDKTGNLATDIADTKMIIEHLADMCERRINIITHHIATIDDSRLKQIVELRCVDDLSWIQIGHRMHSTADACRMTFNRAYPE